MGIFIFMTVYNALLIDIAFTFGAFRCTFCNNRDKFVVPIPENEVMYLNTGEYYNVDFDISTDTLNNVFSFNFINPAKDTE